MRTNKLVWLGLACIVFMAVVVVINKSNDQSDGSQMAGSAPQKDLSHVKVRPNAVEGDTVVESLTEVQARYEEKDEEIRKLKSEISAMQGALREVEEAQGRSKSKDNPLDKIVSRIENVSSNMDMLTKQFETQTEQLKTTSANGYSFNEQDLGWGENSADNATNPYRRRSGSADSGNNSLTNRLSGYVSVVPILKKVAHTSFENASDLTEKATGQSLTGLADVKDEEVRPVGTISARSTLLDNVAMTALIGRVPVDGKLKSPFPAKIIVGNNNLATNGIKIPGIKGVVFEGIATGNWNLSCVSVHLTAATFTFNDGRIQHMTGGASGASDKSSTSALSPISGESISDAIGYVSDKYGVPCIAGKRITDAHKQIAALGLLGMGAGYFDARANAEVTNVVGDERTTSVVTGDNMEYATNSMLADGANAVVDLYKDRFRDTFDAIVTPPGAKLTIHISKDLLIDYDPNARKVVYSDLDNGGLAHGLD